MTYSNMGRVGWCNACAQPTQHPGFSHDEWLSRLARRTDPQTSFDAAASLKDVKTIQSRIHGILRAYNGLTDEEIRMVYEKAHGEASASSLRTRRKELVEQGLVVDSGERRPMKSGRMGIVWKAV